MARIFKTVQLCFSVILCLEMGSTVESVLFALCIQFCSHLSRLLSPSFFFQHIALSTLSG